MSKLTLNQVSKICDIRDKSKVEIPFKISDTETIIVTFKTSLSFIEMDAIVNKVVNSVFTIDGEYLPTYKDVIFFGTILKQLSNMPVPEKKILDEETGKYFKVMDLEKLYDIMEQTEIMDKIYNMFNSNNESEVKLWRLVNRLKEKIYELIEYRKQELLHKKESKFDKLLDTINNFVSQLDKQVEKLDLNSLSEYIPTIANALKDDKFNTEELVKAIIKTQAKEVEDTKEFDSVININNDN